MFSSRAVVMWWLWCDNYKAMKGQLSVSLAVSLWQCSPQIALNRSTCFLWMGKIGPIYIFTHRYWSQQVFLFSKRHLPKALSQKLLFRPINHEILHVLHICAFLSCFLGSGCLTAGTIFHISLHTALMSLCTRLTWPRSWHQVSSTYIMKALNA